MYISDASAELFHIGETRGIWLQLTWYREYFKMASLRDAVTMYQTLTQEWNKRPPNLDRCGEHLGKLKVRIMLRSWFK